MTMTTMTTTDDNNDNNQNDENDRPQQRTMTTMMTDNDGGAVRRSNSSGTPWAAGAGAVCHRQAQVRHGAGSSSRVGTARAWAAGAVQRGIRLRFSSYFTFAIAFVSSVCLNI